ncbi:MAG: VOC family protein [Actinobacteria bacterium]|nr:VOC family protein [Actinomycetota bacterium]
MPVRRLNHAVLYVRDAHRSAAFYSEALGMEVLTDLGRAVFLTLPAGDAHHDLGLFEVGGDGPAAGSGPGLYHLAWEVERFEDLVDRRTRLLDLGALTGESDHGATLSLYAVDPDGIEFEVCWQLPEEAWAGVENQAVTRRLDWAAAADRWADHPG